VQLVDESHLDASTPDGWVRPTQLDKLPEQHELREVLQPVFLNGLLALVGGESVIVQHFDSGIPHVDPKLDSARGWFQDNLELNGVVPVCVVQDVHPDVRLYLPWIEGDGTLGFLVVNASFPADVFRRVPHHGGAFEVPRAEQVQEQRTVRFFGEKGIGRKLHNSNARTL